MARDVIQDVGSKTGGGNTRNEVKPRLSRNGESGALVGLAPTIKITSLFTFVAWNMSRMGHGNQKKKVHGI